MTRSIFYAVAMALVGCSEPVVAPHDILKTEFVWLSDLNWIAKPEGLSGEYGSATVLLFEPEGGFRMADCTLMRWNGTVSVSEGDGFVRYTGSWKAARNGVVVKYALDSPTRLIARPHVSGPPNEAFMEIRKLNGKVQLSMSGRIFYPDRRLDKIALSFLLGI